MIIEEQIKKVHGQIMQFGMWQLPQPVSIFLSASQFPDETRTVKLLPTAMPSIARFVDSKLS